jgi:hypothetical protein
MDLETKNTLAFALVAFGLLLGLWLVRLSIDLINWDQMTISYRSILFDEKGLPSSHFPSLSCSSVLWCC